jgi:N-acetylmuramic acid 6-phosphate (MurNAc-6-P) etherase
MDLARSFSDSLQRHRDTFAAAEQYQAQAIQLLDAVKHSLQSGGKVVFMGNGGSAADCQHLAAEFMVRSLFAAFAKAEDDEDKDDAKEKAEDESDTGDKAVDTDEEPEKKGVRNRSRGVA